MTRAHTLVIFALATIVGCHSGTPAVGGSSTPPSTVDDPARAPDATVEAERREYSAPSLRALDRRPIVGPPPRIEIVHPKRQALVARGPVMLKLQVTRWKLAPAPGPFNDVTTSFEVSEGCRFLGLIPDDMDDEDEEVLE